MKRQGLMLATLAAAAADISMYSVSQAGTTKEIAEVSRPCRDTSSMWVGPHCLVSERAASTNAETVLNLEPVDGSSSPAIENNRGVAFRDGLGSVQNDEKAATLFRNAAVRGLAEAQYNLAFMLRKGRGVDQDETQAVDWYYKAARQGYAPAQTMLGLMLRFG